ncbi:hypothetical protein FB451DRAFT_166736 [Mycena latifolia]|nr:hypothetical protein FB451DRAFT_166736 [Mycena latifolia]
MSRVLLTTLTQVFIGSYRVDEHGAWSSSILIHTLPSRTVTRLTQPRRHSLYRSCHQAVSSFPSPSFGPACSARDGSGEGGATKVAQPSALNSFPKVLKSRRRAKARRPLVFPRLRLRWCATPGYVHFSPRYVSTNAHISILLFYFASRPPKHEAAPGSSPPS